MPNIGYETIGGTPRTLNGSARGMKITMPEAGAMGVTVTAYIEDSAPGDSFRAALVSNVDDETILATSDIRTNISAAGWYAFSGGGLAAFTPTNGQIFSVVVGSDSAANANMYHDGNAASPLDGWVAGINTIEPFSTTGPLGIDGSRDYSIYMTYSVAGGATPPVKNPVVTTVRAFNMRRGRR